MSEPIEAGDLVAMRRALRALVDASPLSMATIEAMAGLPRNYLPKMLGEPPVRGLSAVAIFSLLPIVAHKIALVPDPEAGNRIKMRHDYVVCDERQRRKGKSHHQRAKALAQLAQWGQDGAKKRWANISIDEFSAHQSRAAKRRWRAYRKEKRALELAQKLAAKSGALQKSAK